MTANQQWWLTQQPVGFSGPRDPYYDNVVLLLRGSDFSDHSPLHAVPALSGAITLDSSAPNGDVGTTSYRAAGIMGPNFTFAACPEFRKTGTFTLEFWVYFDNEPSNNLALLSNSGTKFVQFLHTGGAGNANIGAQGWSPTLFTTVPPGTWNHYVIVHETSAPGVPGETAQWLNGAQVSHTLGFTLVVDSTDQDLEIISALGTGGDHRMMEIRYTQGVARYAPTVDNVTIPVQTAPWPDHGPLL